MYDINDIPLPNATKAQDATDYTYTRWEELRSYDYGGQYTGPISGETLEIPQLNSGDTPFTAEALNNDTTKDLIHGYYACVSYVDAQIGRLLNHLKSTGMDKNTIVVLWGDQGFHLGEHGQWCKHTNLEEATKIPLFIKVPWKIGGKQINNLVEALDIYPTISNLCGLTPPDNLQGKNISGLINNSNDNLNTEYIFTQYARNNNQIMGYCVRNDRYRYTRWFNISNTPETYLDEELYDIIEDPDELENIAGNSNINDIKALLETQIINYRTENTICFRGDTQVKTSDGYKNIENLKRGDMVMTNAGAQPLAKLSKGLPTSMIKIPKDLLSKNVPNRDVVVCPWHPLSVKILTGDDDEPEFLHMWAGELEIFDEVKKVDEGNAAYNLIFDKHHEVDVGGMKFLSHHPNHNDGKHPRLAEGEEIDASKRAKKVYVSKDGTFVNYKGTTIKDLLKQKPENISDKEYLASVLRFN